MKLIVDLEIVEKQIHTTYSYSFNQHFSSIYSMPGTVLGAGALK